MKHLNYIILVALCAAVPLQIQAQAKPDTGKAEAEARRKAAEEKKKVEAEARRKAAEEKRKADEEYRKLLKEINDEIGTMDKKRMLYAERIARLKVLAEKPEYALPGLQHRIHDQIIRYCQTPGWTTISRYRYETKDTELVPAVEKIQSLDLPVWQKIGSLRALSVHYCDLQKFAEAEQAARRIFDLPKLNKNQMAEAHCALANVYRLQDRYDDAMKEIGKAMEYHKGIAVGAGAKMALQFNRLDDAEKLWEQTGDLYGKLVWFKGKKGYEKFMPDAIAFVKNPEHKFQQRLDLARLYFGETYGTAEMAHARKSLAPQAKENKVRGNWHINNLIRNPYNMQDYRLAAEWCAVFDGTPVMDDLQNRKIRVISLGALKQNAEAAKLAEEYSRTENLAPADKTAFLCYAAILSGKTEKEILKNAKLSVLEEAALILDLAKNCLTPWNMQELARKYSADYEKYFADQKHGQKSFQVKYFETPVSSISAWRQIEPQLEKQYCNIRFRGSTEFLQTDVSGIDRSMNPEVNANASNTYEISTLCDKFGLHIFLRTEAKNVRDIENGFAKGLGTDIYFAPGINQPYSCFGVDLRNGVNFIFDTTYNNKNAKRLDRKSPKKSFRADVEFTDTDYVIHLFFAWNGFYNKLPAGAGDVWRFECITWTPAGGFSWGGSQGIHSASKWGNLIFNLTEKQLAAIRKDIIFSTYRDYKKVFRNPRTTENLFELWGDEEIGDPDFYAKYLAPMQKELDAYAKMVKADMSDEDVAKVYSEALPKWKGLTHEIDELRRKYLMERLIRTGQ